MSEQRNRPDAPSPAEDADVIPVSGIKPAYLALGAGAALVIVIAVVMTSVIGKSKVPEITPAGAAVGAPVSTVDTSKMTPEELKAHLEMTRKAIELSDAEAAKAKAQAEAAKAQAEAAKAAEADAPKATGKAAGASPAPASGQSSKKAAAKLDDIAAEITGALQ